MWPNAECEWCGEPVRLERDGPAWKLPDGWRIVLPPPGYRGGGRIADSDACAAEILAVAREQADGKGHGPALADPADRWQCTSNG